MERSHLQLMNISIEGAAINMFLYNEQDVGEINEILLYSNNKYFEFVETITGEINRRKRLLKNELKMQRTNNTFHWL